MAIVQTFQIAHINQGGVNVVVVFVDASVGLRTPFEQASLATALHKCAMTAGLLGNIAMVWPGGFWAPKNQHPFFASPGGSYQSLSCLINKNLMCNAQ